MLYMHTHNVLGSVSGYNDTVVFSLSCSLMIAAYLKPETTKELDFLSSTDKLGLELLPTKEEF